MTTESRKKFKGKWTYTLYLTDSKATEKVTELQKLTLRIHKTLKSQIKIISSCVAIKNLLFIFLEQYLGIYQYIYIVPFNVFIRLVMLCFSS